MSEATRVVTAYFTALANRDFGTARAAWRDSGVWHVAGLHDLAGDYDPDAYIAMLERWFGDFPEYAVSGFEMRTYGEDVVLAHLVTTGGASEGTASGLMIYRVSGSLIVEGWGIPTFDGGRWPF